MITQLTITGSGTQAGETTPACMETMLGRSLAALALSHTASRR